MSGIDYIEVSLSEVIKDSDVIAIVKRNQPFYIVEEVPIHKDKQKFPPFKKTISLFEVVDILYKNDNVDPAVFSGKTIKVLPAEYNRELDLYKRYHLEGAMKTAPINRYKGYDEKLEKSNECIVFLRYNQNEKMLEFTSFGSVEALKEKNEIVKSLVIRGKRR